MTRQSDLAKIHIARKDLRLDEDAYRVIIRDIGQADSGSASDLTATGRARVLAHFKHKGWKPKGRKKAANKASQNASDGQVRMIRAIWIRLADENVVRDHSEAALRTWIKVSTRRYHPQRVGYDAPEMLPFDAASHLIEHLKKWAARTGVELDR